MAKSCKRIFLKKETRPSCKEEASLSHINIASSSVYRCPETKKPRNVRTNSIVRPKFINYFWKGKAAKCVVMCVCVPPPQKGKVSPGNFTNLIIVFMAGHRYCENCRAGFHDHWFWKNDCIVPDFETGICQAELKRRYVALTLRKLWAILSSSRHTVWRPEAFPGGFQHSLPPAPIWKAQYFKYFTQHQGFSFSAAGWSYIRWHVLKYILPSSSPLYY